MELAWSRWPGEDSVIRKEVIYHLQAVITSSLIINKQNKQPSSQYGLLYTRERQRVSPVGYLILPVSAAVSVVGRRCRSSEQSVSPRAERVFVKVRENFVPSARLPPTSQSLARASLRPCVGGEQGASEGLT